MNSKKDSDGNSTARQHKRATSGDQQSYLTELGKGKQTNTPGDLMKVAVMFQRFLHVDNGYLKVKRDVDGDDVHFTWTFTYGQWAGHYLYVRDKYYQAGHALEVLMWKFEDVEDGRRVPTRDRYPFE